jgi:two-component system, OmpR family, response regulator
MSQTMSTPAHRVAVVEDDHHLRHDLIDFLTWKGWSVVGCESAESFEALHQRSPVDLVVLDLGLSRRSGLEVLHDLCQQPHRPGVVVLTASGTDEDRIKGLTQGADAYLVKGASLELIEATCRSVLRRLVMQPVAGLLTVKNPHIANVPADPQPLHAGWRLNVMRAELHTPNGQLLALTHMECVFLHSLMQAPGDTVMRERLMVCLGKPCTPSNLRNLDNCAARLRRKVMETTGLTLPVRTSYGVGYAFADAAQIVAPP